MTSDPPDRPGPADGRGPATGFTAVLRLREYRLLWLADIQSLLGDQIARVALSVLVFHRTHSGLATAAVYALTFLPAVFGSVLLGHLADRLPRRGLLVAGDVIRAVLLAAMAIPDQPLPVLAGLLVVAVLVGTPWKAAESALVVDILPTPMYQMGLGLRSATNQAAQLVGFAVGGLAVATIGSQVALAADAATFAVSALIIRFGVRARPRLLDPEFGGAWTVRRPGWLDGPRSVFGDPRLRLLLAFSCLLGLIVVPEGLAAPYAAQLHGDARTVGLLLAVGPAGVLLGTVLYARRLSAVTQAALLGPFAGAAGMPLVLCVFRPGLALTCVLWALAGSFTGYQVQVVTEFVQTISPQIRGQGIAVASAALLGAQGIGLLAAGVITQLTSPTTAVAAAGATAGILGCTLALIRRHHRAGRPPAVR